MLDVIRAAGACPRPLTKREKRRVTVAVDEAPTALHVRPEAGPSVPALGYTCCMRYLSACPHPHVFPAAPAVVGAAKGEAD